MLNDWFSFDTELLHENFLEAARTRTYKRYSQVLVRFLLKTIPQSPDFKTENFSKLTLIRLGYRCMIFCITTIICLLILVISATTHQKHSLPRIALRILLV